MTFALVQSFGSVLVSSDWLNMAVMRGANSADNSFKMRLGILSGPLALRTFSCPRSFFTPGSVIFSFEMSVCFVPYSLRVGMFSSFVKTDSNCLLRISALSLLSLYSFPSDLRGATPVLSCLCCLMYFQKGFVSLFSDFGAGQFSFGMHLF